MKELRKRLLSEIADRLKPNGYRKTQQAFRRAFPGGCWMFHIALIPHAKDFDITADVAIRHDSIQDASRLYDHLDDQERKMTATLGAELGNLLGTGQHRWTIRRDADVVPVADSIVQMFRTVGVPFLERFTSLAETKRVLIEDEKLSRLICPNPPYREEIVQLLKSGKVA